MMQIERNKQKVELINHKIYIEAMFSFKNVNRCDTSNYVKLLWDALKKAAIIKDDNLIWKELLEKRQTFSASSVDITIYEY